MLYQSGSTAATADSYTFTETALLDSGLLVGNVITLDTLSNDASGLSIYSIDDNVGSSTITAAQLQQDDLKKTATTSAWETLASGDRIRIVDNKIELDITASLTRFGVTRVEDLKDGQVITLSFAYAVEYTGGTKPVDWTTVSFTLTGQSVIVNRVPTLGGDSTGEVVEDSATVDGSLATSGLLTITDPDANQSSYIAQTSTAGTYGTFTLSADGAWTYTANNSQDAIQQLGAGQTLTDSFTAVSQDGSASQVVEVTIQGSDDKAEVYGDYRGVLDEDGLSFTASGTLTVIDRDAGQATFTTSGTVAGQYGSFEFTPGADGIGQWTYVLDNQNPAVQALGAGDSMNESFTVNTAGGGRSTVTVTIRGTNDVPDVSGVATGSVIEDSDASTGGQLSIIDVDTNQSFWTVPGGTLISGGTPEPLVDKDGDGKPDQPSGGGGASPTEPASYQGQYGVFTLTGATGVWSYALDNTLGAVQALAGDQTATDTLRLVSSDGTVTRDLEVTITGKNDAATISSTDTGSDTGSVAEDAGTGSASGRLSVVDPDAGQAAFQPLDDKGLSRVYGDFSFNATTGEWTYQLRNGGFAVQALREGQTVVDTLTVTSLDGTASHTITVNITGQGDAAEVSGTLSGKVLEDGRVTTSGTITVVDPDQGEAKFQTPAGGRYGTLALTEAGDGTTVWTYTLRNADPDVQALGEGDMLTDTVVLTTVGKEDVTIEVTIVGTNDLPTVGGVNTGALTEDGPTDTVEGQLTIADVDSGESGWTLGRLAFEDDVQLQPAGTYFSTPLTFVSSSDGDKSQTPVDVIARYGTFTFDGATGQWRYTLDNSRVQPLADGQQVEDSIKAVSFDGTTTRDIVVTITGTDDIATITGDKTGEVAAGGTTTASGTLQVLDSDDGQAYFEGGRKGAEPQSFTGQYGTFVFNPESGEWNYTLATDSDAVRVLGAGVPGTDTMTVYSLDRSASETITVQVTGVNDAARITGDTLRSLTEDGTASTSGVLSVSDPDTNEARFGSSTSTRQYGSFATTSSGGTLQWTYTLANSSLAVQSVAAGQTVQDTLTVTSADGTDTETVTVQIVGVNDVASISGTTAGVVTEDLVRSTTGAMFITDVDRLEGRFAMPTYQSNYGSFSFSFTSTSSTSSTLNWTYTLNNDSLAVQSLGANVVGQDQFTARSMDGTAEQIITVSVVGANDAATFSGDKTGSVTAGSLQTTTFGTLRVNDVDTGQSGFQSLGSAQIAGANGYGNFTFNASAGSWNYTLSTSQAAVRWLGAGQSLTDSLLVRSTDGTSQSIAVTILGDPSKQVLSSAADTVILENNGQTRILVGFNPSNDTLQLGSSFTGLVDRNGNIAAEHWVTFNNTGTFAASEAVPYARMVWIPGASGEGALYYVPAMSTTLGTAVAQFGLLTSTPQPVDVTLAVMAPTMPTTFTGFVTGTEGNDVMNGTTGAETIRGFGGDDIIYTAGADTAYGGTGNDRLYTNTSGPAFLYGEDGNDLFFGVFNTNAVPEMLGGAGDDTFYGADSAEVMFGGTGNDLLFGGGGNDSLDGEAGNDWIDGGNGIDQLYGGDGEDHLFGGDGNDGIGGDAGNDWLTGNSGNDKFYFDAPLNVAGVDHITDFTNGQDLIYLEKIDFSGLATAPTSSEVTLLAADFAGLSTGGATADVGTARIVYDASTGNLYYDADGGSSANRTLFAILDNKPPLTALDAGDFRVS